MTEKLLPKLRDISYKNPKDCKKLTKDMQYMDKKYKLGTTIDICDKPKKD